MSFTTQEWRANAKHFAFMRNQIAYWTGGNPNGRPLLLVHGFPTCSWDWVPMWEKLGENHFLMACDMLGFGMSDKPRRGHEGGGYSITNQALIQEVFLSHLGIEEYDALVHDYGVSVGQELLAMQQEEMGAKGLGKVIFLNGGIFPDQHRPVLMQKIGVSPVGFLLGLLNNRELFGKSFSAVFGPHTKPSEAELDTFWEFIAHNSGHRIMHKLLHYIADRVANKESWEESIVRAENKIGLINGALDPVSGKHAYDMWRDVVPNARHHLIETVGHYPQVEAPDEVARVALEWLAA